MNIRTIPTTIRKQLTQLQSSSQAWIALLCAVLILFIVVGILLSLLIRSPNEAAIKNSAATPEVTTKIQQRSFSSQTEPVKGKVTKGATKEVFVSGEADVVTALNVKVGDTVTSGSVLGRVSGQPILVLNMPFALYRNINAGDAGDDVRAVQIALAALGLFRGYADGTYGAYTAQAVELLYRRNALLPPPKPQPEPVTTDTAVAPDTNQPVEFAAQATPSYTPLLKSEIVTMNSNSAVVSAIAGVGTKLGSEQAFATLKVGGTTVSFRLPASEVEKFPAGTKLSVASPADNAATATATVTAKGKFTTDSNLGSYPGYDMTARLESDDATFTDGSEVIVKPTKNQAELKGLSVPVTALRQKGNSYYLTTTKERKELPVEVSQVIDGYALLKGADLKDGTEVIVTVK